VRWVVQTRLGSALRLSQPLSGFLALPSFTALFHAATVCGIPLFRAFPSTKIAFTPLEAASSLAVIHQRADPRRSPPCRLRFRLTPALSRSCLASPADYGLPFHEPKLASRLSWATRDGTGSFRQLHLLRSFVPFVESVRSSSGLPLGRWPMLS